MYLDFWQMRLLPFENVPNPHFYYPAFGHEEALQRLIYTIDQGKGAAMVSGDIGCGKTLVGNTLADRLADRNCRVARMTNPSLSSLSFLQTVATLFDAENSRSRSKASLWRSIETVLRRDENSSPSVLIIDEAQCISDPHTFEELRMLLNLQSEDRFLINIILLGQRELEANLQTRRSLNQRIAIKYRLLALTPPETEAYIRHRLEVAGCQDIPFGPEAMARINDFAQGIPRIINNLCDRSLLAALIKQTRQITPEIVTQAWKDFNC